MPDDTRALREREAMERAWRIYAYELPEGVPPTKEWAAAFIAGLRYRDGECETFADALRECGVMANALEDDAFVAARKGSMLNARRVQYEADRIASKALSALSAARKASP